MTNAERQIRRPLPDALLLEPGDGLDLSGSETNILTKIPNDPKPSGPDKPKRIVDALLLEAGHPERGVALGVRVRLAWPRTVESFRHRVVYFVWITTTELCYAAPGLHGPWLLAQLRAVKPLSCRWLCFIRIAFDFTVIDFLLLRKIFCEKSITVKSLLRTGAA
jgi:hypothetical protein